MIFVPNLFCGLIFVPNLFCGFIFILRRPFSFQIYLADTGEGPFLRTGDLGFIQAGERFVTGVLNLRGMVGKRAVKSGFIIEFIVARLPTLQKFKPIYWFIFHSIFYEKWGGWWASGR